MTAFWHRCSILALFAAGMLAGQTALAAMPTFNIVIENHTFQPAEIEVPAGQKIKLVVENRDATPEEFESHELNREKVIVGNDQATIYLGPLEAGTYKFFGEFFGPKGHIVAK